MVADFFINHPFLGLLIGAVMFVLYIYLIVLEAKEGEE